MEINILIFALFSVITVAVFLYIIKLYFEQLRSEIQITLNENLNFLAKETVKLINTLDKNQTLHNTHVYKLLDAHQKAYKFEIGKTMQEAQELVGKLRLSVIDLSEVKKRPALKEVPKQN